MDIELILQDVINLSTIFLEYKIIHNRPGLLGDIASLLGLLNINILNIASINNNFRGLLIELENEVQKKAIYSALKLVKELDITAFREPNFIDLLALRHGKRIKPGKEQNYYIFDRSDLDILIDFLGGYLKKYSNIKIGIKGSPRIGKTETSIAAAVHANKHWQLLSSTLIRKIARSRISEELLDGNTVLIIDAITTFRRSRSEHIKFIKKIVQKNLPIMIEHPEIFIQETDFKMNDFKLIIELIDKNKKDEKKIIDYTQSFNSFDIG